MVSTYVLAQTEQIFAWYNAVFVILFGVGLFFTFLQLLGLGHDSDVDAHADMDGHLDVDAHADVGMDAHADLDAHADMDADADVDADADMDADADVDADADMDADADVGGHLEAHVEADADADTDASVQVPAGAAHVGGSSALAQMLGLGKVPLSISLMLLCYSMGITGWMSNELLSRHVTSPKAFFPLSLLASLVAALAVVRFTSVFMGRYMPTLSTSAMDKRKLVGLSAKATLPVNERFGQACLYDKFGTLHVVGCKVRDGGSVIEKGADVVLIKYVPDRDLYLVGRA